MDVRQQNSGASRLAATQSPIAISVPLSHCWTTLPPLHYTGYCGTAARGTLCNTGQTVMLRVDAAERPGLSGGPLLERPGLSGGPLLERPGLSGGPLLERPGLSGGPLLGRPGLSGGPLLEDYVFEQMHFHWAMDDHSGTEHVLDGHGYAAECHLVHYNTRYGSFEAALHHADGLAVVGVMLQAHHRPNPGFTALQQGLKHIRNEGDCVPVNAGSCLRWVLPALGGSYVTYRGSLTTPPYSECVIWILYHTPVPIATQQLECMRELRGSHGEPIGRNVRATQSPPSGHHVLYVRHTPANTSAKL